MEECKLTLWFKILLLYSQVECYLSYFIFMDSVKYFVRSFGKVRFVVGTFVDYEE